MKTACVVAVVLASIAFATAEARAQLGEESAEGIGLPVASLRTETAASYMNLSLDSRVLGVPASAGGVVTGAALDVRVLSMMVGGRFRVHQLVDYNAWQFGPSVGFRFPIGTRFHVGGDLSVGHLRVASFTTVPVDSPPTGTFVGASGSADWFVRRWLSLGGVVDVQLLFMERRGAHGVGISTSLGPRLSFHF